MNRIGGKGGRGGTYVGKEGRRWSPSVNEQGALDTGHRPGGAAGDRLVRN